jgi:carbon-monoxide dehydrogenase large subunit
MHPEGIGAPVLRREDRRFLTGRGQYVSDIVLEGELHCAFVRSPHAHARFGVIDKSAALAAPGVVTVFTGADMAADRVGTMVPLWQIPGVDGKVMNEPPRWALSRGTVRHVGEAVAVVVATSRTQAQDAAEKVATTSQALGAAMYANTGANAAGGAGDAGAGEQTASSDDDVVDAEIVDEDQDKQ